MSPSQFGVDEAARDPGQLVQVEPAGQPGGEYRLQLGGGVGGFAEDPAEHRVVGA
jgi:hypothetical protein